jgi:hypothetical protein
MKVYPKRTSHNTPDFLDEWLTTGVGNMDSNESSAKPKKKKRKRLKLRISRTRFALVELLEHEHRPPICCGKLFTRPITEQDRSADNHSVLRPLAGVKDK